MSRLLYYLRYDWPLHLVMLLTSWLPNNVVFFRIRGLLARPFFGSCGANLRLGRNTTFYNASNIRLGRDVYIALGCVLLGNGVLELGDQVMLGPYVVIATGNHTKVDGSYRFGRSEVAAVRIGYGSWIGAHSTITSGSTIGRGCAIGSNAVVRGKIPDGSVAVGVPATVRKQHA